MLYFNNRNKKLSNALLTKTNEELRLMKDIAEENANLKSQFISTISHELRTPLNGIVGITNLITNQKPINNANIEHLNA